MPHDPCGQSGDRGARFTCRTGLLDPSGRARTDDMKKALPDCGEGLQVVQESGTCDGIDGSN